jgi:four helix bundle protein
MSVRCYKDLVAWQRGVDLAALVYQATEQFPSQERFGLTNQMRRAAVSVPSNIAEGQGRGSTRDFLNFLGIARGSLQELETQILIAGRLKFLSESAVDELSRSAAEVSRIIGGLRNALSKR